MKPTDGVVKLQVAEKCRDGKILSPWKIVDPGIVGIRSTFRGSKFFDLVEIRLKADFQSVECSEWAEILLFVCRGKCRSETE